MGSISEGFALFFLLILAIPSLMIVGVMPFGLAQNGTTVNGVIINSDTT